MVSRPIHEDRSAVVYVGFILLKVVRLGEPADGATETFFERHLRAPFGERCDEGIVAAKSVHLAFART